MYGQQGASFTLGCYLEIGHVVSCKGTSFIFPVLEPTPPGTGGSPRGFPGPLCADTTEGDTLTSLRDGVFLLPVKNICVCTSGLYLKRRYRVPGSFDFSSSWKENVIGKA